MADYKSAPVVMDQINNKENSNVLIYPNPSSGDFKISTVNNEIITGIEISDITGRLVYKSSISNINNKEINTNFLPDGTFLVSVSTETNNYKLKLLIVK